MIDGLETIQETSKHLPQNMRLISWAICSCTAIAVKFNAVFLIIPLHQWVSIVLQWTCFGCGILTALIGFYEFLVRKEIVSDFMKDIFKRNKSL